MKEETIEKIRDGWNARTLQFEYPLHAKQWTILWHIAAAIFSVLLCYVHKYFGFGVILCLISWNYLFLFDTKRRVYNDSYVPQRYEYIGTIYADILIIIFVVVILIR